MTPSESNPPPAPRRDTRALAASELRYRRLFETEQDGILILDAETGMVVDVNPFLIALLGCSYEQCVGKAIWELGFFKEVVANREKFLKLQQQYVRHENLPLETINGDIREVEFVSNVYLAGGVAHDFNNLLTGIMGYVELCRQQVAPAGLTRCAAPPVVRPVIGDGPRLRHRRQHLVERDGGKGRGGIGHRVGNDQLPVVHEASTGIHDVRHIAFAFVRVGGDQRLAQAADHA